LHYTYVPQSGKDAFHLRHFPAQHENFESIRQRFTPADRRMEADSDSSPIVHSFMWL